MRVGRAAGVALVLPVLFAGVERAAAATFTVDSTGSGADVAIDATCDADANVADLDCTLRAAIEEANATAGSDTVLFKKSSAVGGDPDDVSFSAGQGSATVTIAAAPPQITQPVTVDGGNCQANPLLPASPCAVVAPGWTVDAAGEVLIRGLAFGGALTTAIRVIEVNGTFPAIPDFQLYGNWFGIDTQSNDVTAPNTSVLLEDVSGARIGSGFADDRNLFARQEVGIDVFGADQTEIFGNDFGVLPDGSFARTGEAENNDHNIEVTGNAAPNPDDEAIGTEIGASSAVQAATPECDGACNLISGAGFVGIGFPGSAAGITLTPDEAGEVPAGATEILGNRIETNVRAIDIGDADDVHIGGPAAGDADRNIIGDNETSSTAGATGLLVQNNVFGSDPAAPPLSLRGSGEVLDNRFAVGSSQASIRLANTSPPNFTVQGNVIGEQANGVGGALGGIGIHLLATASGNLIGGTAPGDGNLISETSVIPPNSIGIRIEGDDNEVIGNRLGVGSDGSSRPLIAGIDLLADADGNRIGGDTAASENLISNSNSGNTVQPGNAIQILDAASDGNEILRNRGASNEALFIDLGGDGAAGNLVEPNGPNGGAQAPAISAVSLTAATGTAAPGALVRVFTKTLPAAGEIDGYLTEVTADGSGAWTASFGSVPVGQALAATATTAGGTSELSNVATAAAPPDPPPPDPPPAVDADPPETTIDKAPKRKTKRRKATFAFSSDEPGSAFECQLDRRPRAPCESPLSLKRLKRGKHTFSVSATDAAGNPDPSPATHAFKVKRKRKRR